MKKHIAAWMAALSVAAFGGCAAGGPGAYEKGALSSAPPPESPAIVSGQIAPAKLTEKEEQLVALLTPGMQYQIFEFKLDGAVKTVRLMRYRLENGAWAPDGGSSQTIDAASGQIALVTDSRAGQNRLALQSGGGGSTVTYDLPEDVGNAGMASAVSYLSEVAQITEEAEIPLQVQIFTAQDSLSSYDVSAFDTPALYAQHGYEHVYAVTVAFSPQALGQGDEDAAAGPQDGAFAGEPVSPPSPETPDANTPAGSVPVAQADLGERQVRENQTIYETLYPSFSPYVKTIPFDVINDTDREYGTGDRFRLQRLENGEWVNLPQLPLPKSDGDGPIFLNPAISGPFWPPHTRTRRTATVDTIDGTKYPLYSLPLQAGAYRLTDDCHNISNVFEITDAPSVWQKSTIERLRKIPVFEGVAFSPRDFSVPFVCQGVISDSDVSGVKLYAFYFPDWLEAQAVFESIGQNGYVIPQYSRQNDRISTWNPQEFNWEDTPHFYYVNSNEIYLYCGDDAAILSALPDAVTVVNYS